jgi:HKD family nuclease
MLVRVIDNTSHDLVATLTEGIQRSNDIRIASAFVSRKGLALLEKAIEGALQAGAKFDFVIGLDTKITEPGALRYLYDLSQSCSTLKLSCFVSERTTGLYHPKIYLLRVDDRVTSIIGSSNLTTGGLRRNLEINVLMDGAMSDEAISDAYAKFSELKIRLNKAPDDEYIELYARAFDEQKKATRASTKSDAVRAFKEKAKSLPPPKLDRSDLVGWLDLVHQVLPSDVFTNDQVYAHESEFQKLYPNNRNVRAKIRQQLQMLRNMGLIEHIGASQWRKL